MIQCYFVQSVYLPQEKIFFDSAEELEALEEYAKENDLKMGSLAVNCANGEEYILDSANKWHKKGATL